MLFLLYISFTWPLILGRQALGDITVDVLAQAKRMELAMTGQNFLTTVCQATRRSFHEINMGCLTIDVK